MEDWAVDNGVELQFIQKGKPNQNGYVERFNRTFRTEVLDAYAFDSLNQVRVIASAWMWMYNNERPHGSLRYHTPISFMLKYGKLHTHNDQGQFPTFQHDIHNKNWKSLILNATN